MEEALTFIAGLSLAWTFRGWDFLLDANLQFLVSKDGAAGDERESECRGQLHRIDRFYGM